MKKVVYIGAFPPPYGGVTVKNEILYTAVQMKLEVERVDLSAVKRGVLRELMELIGAFLRRDEVLVIGVAGEKTRRRFCRALYYINRPVMDRSLIFLMGGSVTKDIAKDSNYQRYVGAFRSVYAETEGMIDELRTAGVRNARLYPNCRFRPAKCYSVRESGQRLRCVFFSLIHAMKGADIVLEAARRMPGVEFVFYGAIDKDYRERFLECVNCLENVAYNGVFIGRGEETYEELAKYDVLLLPTRWKAEGVPGVLVEAKIAGIPAIVSDICYNTEIVEDGVSGIVLKENTPEEVANAIRMLDKDRAHLRALQCGARRSAEDYYIDNYIEDMIGDITGGYENRVILLVFAVYSARLNRAVILLGASG